MSTLFPVTIEYLSSMRIGVGPSNNLSIEIPHRSADMVWSAVCVKTQNYAYLRSMLVYTLHAGIVNTSMKCKYQHES